MKLFVNQNDCVSNSAQLAQNFLSEVYGLGVCSVDVISTDVLFVII